MIETPAFAQRSGFRDGVQGRINAVASACGSRDKASGAVRRDEIIRRNTKHRRCDAVGARLRRGRRARLSGNHKRIP